MNDCSEYVVESTLNTREGNTKRDWDWNTIHIKSYKQKRIMASQGKDDNTFYGYDDYDERFE